MRQTCFLVLFLLALSARQSIAQGPRVTTQPDQANVRYGSHERHVLDLWLAFHSDLTRQEAADPLERLSTRSTAVGVVGAQSTLDPRAIAKLISPATARHPAFAQLFDVKIDDLFTDRADKAYRDASAMSHLTVDDPPAFLFYSDSGEAVPENAPAGAGVHRPAFGVALKKSMDELGIECVLKLRKDYNNDFGPMFEDMSAFFLRNCSKSLLRR